MDFEKLELNEKDASLIDEKHPMICFTPKIDCTDVSVVVTKVEPKDKCKPDEQILRYKICNFGPGVATDIELKSFICPAPSKVCVKGHKKLVDFHYKNGIFKACLDCLKPCDCFEFELFIKECPQHCDKKFYDCHFGPDAKPPQKYDVTTVIEAKEEDLNICNNVDILRK